MADRARMEVYFRLSRRRKKERGMTTSLAYLSVIVREIHGGEAVSSGDTADEAQRGTQHT